MQRTRRRFLLTAASTATIPILAGCTGSEGDGNEDGGNGDSGGEDDSGDQQESEDESGDGGGDSEEEQDQEDQEDQEDSDSGPEPGEQASGEDVEEYNGLVIQEHELVVEEESGFEDVTIEGIVENTTDDTVDYIEVAVRIYDSDGNQLDSYFTNTTDLQGGGTWKFEVMLIEESDEIEEYDIAVSDSAL